MSRKILLSADKKIALMNQELQEVAELREGYEALQEQNFSLAIEKLSSALENSKIQSSRAEAYICRSHAYYLTGDLENALIDATLSIHLDPTAQAHVRRGMIYLKKAEKHVKFLEEAKCFDQSLKFGDFLHQGAEENFSKITIKLDDFFKIYPCFNQDDQAHIQNSMTNKYKPKLQPKKRETLEKDTYKIYALLVKKLKIKSIEEILSQTKTLIKLDPTRYDYYQLLMVALNQTYGFDDLQENPSQLKEMLEVGFYIASVSNKIEETTVSLFEQLLFMRASYFKKVGQYDQAIKEYIRIIDINKDGENFFRAKFFRGEVYAVLKEYEKACQDFHPSLSWLVAYSAHNRIPSPRGWLKAKCLFLAREWLNKTKLSEKEDGDYDVVLHAIEKKNITLASELIKKTPNEEIPKRYFCQGLILTMNGEFLEGYYQIMKALIANPKLEELFLKAAINNIYQYLLQKVQQNIKKETKEEVSNIDSKDNQNKKDKRGNKHKSKGGDHQADQVAAKQQPKADEEKIVSSGGHKRDSQDMTSVGVLSNIADVEEDREENNEVIIHKFQSFSREQQVPGDHSTQDVEDESAVASNNTADTIKHKEDDDITDNGSKHFRVEESTSGSDHEEIDSVTSVSNNSSHTNSSAQESFEGKAVIKKPSTLQMNTGKNKKKKNKNKSQNKSVKEQQTSEPPAQSRRADALKNTNSGAIKPKHVADSIDSVLKSLSEVRQRKTSEKLSSDEPTQNSKPKKIAVHPESRWNRQGNNSTALPPSSTQTHPRTSSQELETTYQSSGIASVESFSSSGSEPLSEGADLSPRNSAMLDSPTPPSQSPGASSSSSINAHVDMGFSSDQQLSNDKKHVDFHEQLKADNLQKDAAVITSVIPMKPESTSNSVSPIEIEEKKPEQTHLKWFPGFKDADILKLCELVKTVNGLKGKVILGGSFRFYSILQWKQITPAFNPSDLDLRIKAASIEDATNIIEKLRELGFASNHDGHTHCKFNLNFDDIKCDLVVEKNDYQSNDLFKYTKFESELHADGGIDLFNNEEEGKRLKEMSRLTFEVDWKRFVENSYSSVVPETECLIRAGKYYFKAKMHLPGSQVRLDPDFSKHYHLYLYNNNREAFAQDIVKLMDGPYFCEKFFEEINCFENFYKVCDKNKLFFIIKMVQFISQGKFSKDFIIKSWLNLFVSAVISNCNLAVASDTLINNFSFYFNRNVFNDSIQINVPLMLTSIREALNKSLYNLGKNDEICKINQFFYRFSQPQPPLQTYSPVSQVTSSSFYPNRGSQYLLHPQRHNAGFQNANRRLMASARVSMSGSRFIITGNGVPRLPVIQPTSPFSNNDNGELAPLKPV